MKMRASWVWGVLAGAIGLSIGVGVAAEVSSRTERAQATVARTAAELASKPIRILYWNAADDSVTGPYEAGLKRAGMVTVENIEAEGLQEIARQTQIDAIVFDAALRPQMDWTWLRGQLLSGKPVVGLGMTVKDLYSNVQMPVPKVYDVDQPDGSDYFGFVQLRIVANDQATVDAILRLSMAEGQALADLEQITDQFGDDLLSMGFTHLADRLTSYGPDELGPYLYNAIVAIYDQKPQSSVEIQALP